ncbi:uncharacterized protein LOC122672390, partial [Telopea speciosissima]|uniref:uncharacterized protein LOC122672390 n=1 Tax=Telopea speciosissima TaxID=54955 RepID=UPI001CC51C47
MDFGRGLSIPDERRKDIQIQGSWKPVTPAAQIPTRLQPIPAERQGSQIGRTNWLESMGFPAGFCQETPANGAAACVDSMASLALNRRLSNWESPMNLAGSSRVSGSLVDSSHTEAMRNVTAGRKNINLMELLAWTSGASVASSSANLQGNNPFFPVMYSANNYNQNQPDSAGMLLANQDRSLNCEFWNMSNCQSQPLNGFPVHHHSYDLNSLPNTMADCVSNGAMSIPFAPVTPDKEQIIQNQPTERTDSSVGERSYKEQDKQEVFVTPNRKPLSCMNEEVVEVQSELSHPLEGTSSVAASTTLKENHNLEMADDNNGIDLNKTPQQKPRRKKHRPKVVVEGKPKRTPKAAAPKRAGDNQNPTGKRKYVRKKNLKTSETPPAEAVGESIEQSPSLTAKSCKRVLNFDLEDQGRDEHPYKSLNNQEGFLLNSVESSSSRWIFNMNSESQVQNLSKTVDGGSGSKSTVLLGQGIEVMVENTSAGIEYDCNCSSNQVIKDYNSLPETTAPAPQSTKRDPPIESSNCLPNNRNEMEKPRSSLSNGKNSDPLIQQHAQAEGISRMVFQTRTTLDNNEKSGQSLLQCGSQSLSKCQNDPNSNLHVPFVENEQARGSKREYSHTIDKTDAQTMNMRGVQHNSLQAYQEIYQGSGYQRNNPGVSIPEMCKKRRTEKAQYTTTPSSSSSIAANRNGWGQELQSYHGAADDMLGTKGPKNGISKSG